MDPVKDLKWLVGILAVLAVVWFVTGGYDDARSRGGPFLKPPAPLSTGETYGLKNAPAKDSISPLATTISFVNKEGIRGGSPSQEYIGIEASSRNNVPVKITGLKLMGIPYGTSITLGKGYKTHKGKVIAENATVMLEAAEKVIVVTGDVPLIPREIYNSYDPVWIILLNHPRKIWSSSGSILLVDTNGRLIDAFIPVR